MPRCGAQRGRPPLEPRPCRCRLHTPVAGRRRRGGLSRSLARTASPKKRGGSQHVTVVAGGDRSTRKTRVAVSRAAFELFVRVMGEMGSGNAVDIVPVHAEADDPAGGEAAQRLPCHRHQRCTSMTNVPVHRDKRPARHATEGRWARAARRRRPPGEDTPRRRLFRCGQLPRRLWSIRRSSVFDAASREGGISTAARRQSTCHQGQE